MSIQVTCPGCFKRFSVADQHAGKQGPCPNCKQPIQIPEKDEQIVIHEAPPEGPVDSKGRAVLKTFRRKDAKFQPLVALAVVGGVLLFLLLSFVLGRTELKNSWVVLGLGAAVLGPFTARAGYGFLRDDELEPYQGSELWLRAGICGVLFAAAWFIYGFVLSRFTTPEEIAAGLQLWQFWPVVIMFMAGLAAAYVALDLEPVSAFMLFALFFLASAGLRVVMGLPLLPGLVFEGG